MDLSAIRRILSKKNRHESARERAKRELCRRRVFEALEPRQMLDAASAFQTLPEAITIARTDETYHYALEGKNFEFVDSSSLSGLVASLPKGDQISFTIMKTTTDGVVSTLGDVVLQLFTAEGEAPNSSAHILGLVDSNYYEGLKIHRIMEGFMWQGGSPNGDGIGGSGLEIADERSDLLSHSRRGTVALANRGPGTSDAQFYVLFNPTPYLDSGYNIFAYVVSGYDVIDELEKAEVKVNASGEKSSPVDTYTFTNIHRVAETDTTHGILRLSAEYTTNGKTSISINSEDAEGTVKLQQTTVYAGSEGLADYVDDALDAYEFAMTTGGSLTISLPATFGDMNVSYTVTANDGASNFEILPNSEKPNEFTLKSTGVKAQDVILSINAKISEKVLVEQTRASTFDASKYENEKERYSIMTGTSAAGVSYVYVYENVELDASITQAVEVDIASQAPSVSIVGEPVATVDGVLYVGGSFKSADAPIMLSVSAPQANESIVYNGFVVKVDGVTTTYSVSSHSYDESTGMASYLLTLNLSEDPSEGEHTITVQQKLSSETLSDEGSVSFVFDSQPIEFVDAPAAITSYVGVDGAQVFKTNKTNKDGSQRTDVKYSFGDVANVPTFMSLSTTGTLRWNGLVADNIGVYTIKLVATDALGRKAEETVTFSVAGALVFADFTDTSAKTGEKYLGQVLAEDHAASDVRIRYEIVGESNMTIDSETGVLSWDIAADYLEADAVFQRYSFTVKATELTQGADGTWIDGSSITKELSVDVANASYDSALAILPTWNDAKPMPLKAGETFTVNALGGIPEGAESVEFWFDGSVPEGIQVDKNGVVTWTPAENYFGSDTSSYSQEITVTLKGRVVLATDENSINYGETTGTTLSFTVLNPNYKDFQPVFDDIGALTATTGKTFTTTFVAKDPNSRADLIVYELVNSGYPAGLSVGYRSGVLTWDIPDNYLESKAQYQILVLTVKATELYLDPSDEEESYFEGLSTTKEFAITIDNAQYKAADAIVPVLTKVDEQTITAGETFTLELKGEAEGADRIIFDIVGDRPDGMTITEEGKITWQSPSDFILDSNIRSQKLTIKVVASAVSKSGEISTDFSGSTTSTFDLVVNNPKYADAAPVFKEIGVTTVTTGQNASVTIEATDPNNVADRIVYKFDGAYPDDMVLNAYTGVLEWKVPAKYLDASVSSKRITVKIQAVEQTKQEDGSYKDGLSTTKAFDFLVKNASFDKLKSVTPTWDKLESVTVKVGETLETTVKATVATPATGVEYKIGDDAPEGLSIDASSGAITWKVPDNYIEGTSTKSRTVKLKVTATAILSTKDGVSYGNSAETTLEIVVENPKYVDSAPVFNKIDAIVGNTGSTITTVISAKDPVGDADQIVYKLENTNLPKGLTFDSKTGKLVWNVPSDYLASNISAQVYTLHITATKQFKQEDGSFKDGPKTTDSFEVMIANKAVDSTKLVTPTFEKLADQTVEAGKTLTFTVKATLPKNATGTGVYYSFADSSAVPEGMTIDSKTGVVTWKVSKDYFKDQKDDVETLLANVKIQAQTVVSSENNALNYGGSATLEAKITVTRPVVVPEYDSWQTWFDDWVKLAQERYDSHAQNLSAYLASFLEAVKVRDESLTKTANEYKAGKKTLNEALEERKNAIDNYNSTVQDARKELAAADAKTDKEFDSKLQGMVQAYEQLVKDKKTPSNAEELKDDANKTVVKESVKKATGSANFRLTNKSTGASVATNLKDALEMWRSGYSKSTIYDEVFADSELMKDPETGDNPSEGDKPAEGDTPSEGDKPAEGDTPSEGDKPAEGNTPSEGDKPAEGDTPSEGDKPAEGDTPSEGDKTAEGDTPSEGDKPAEGDTPSEGDKPAEGDTPSEGDKPAEGDTPSESDKPAEGNTPSEGDKPAEGATPSEGDKPAEGDTPSEGDKPAEGDAPAGDKPEDEITQ